MPALSRRAFCASIAASAAMAACRKATVAPSWRDTATAALTRAVASLLTRQASDGAFPSDVYGLLRSGQSLTPFALAALQQCPETVPVDADVFARGVAWMGAKLQGGALGFAERAPDYPVYATSLYLTVVHGRTDADPAPSVAWLLGQQLGPNWGEHLGRGGFGMGTPSPPVPPTIGHVDLSMTRRALQALSLHGADAAVLEAGALFASRCRTSDGGFVYSAIDRAVNKGPEVQGSNWGTAQQRRDGVLTYLAAGANSGHPAVVAGLQFLHTHHRWEQNPMVEDGPVAAYATAMRGYWRAAAAEGVPPSQRPGRAGRRACAKPCSLSSVKTVPLRTQTLCRRKTTPS